MEDSYSKREIDIILEGLKTHINDGFAPIVSTLGEVKAQTTKTNGRVSAIENWRWMITGGFSIVTFVVIPMVVYVFNSKVTEVASAAQEIRTMCQYR